MKDNVHHLELVSVGDGFRFDPDEVLEAAKGEGFSNLVLIGERENGDIYLAGMANAGEAVILMEKAKVCIIQGDI